MQSFFLVAILSAGLFRTSPSLAAPTPTPHAAASVVLADDAQALSAEADLHFARRSGGAVDNVAPKTEIDQAIALYRRANAAAPRDFVILAKLMRALHFKGAYTGLDDEAKKKIF